MSDGEWVYVGGIDCAKGGIARTRLGGTRNTDDFALATWRFKYGGPRQLVNVARYTGMTSTWQSAFVHRQHAAFKYELLVLDPGGGGLDVRDKLREPDQYDGNRKFESRPIITQDDEQMAGAGDPVLVLFGRSDSRIRKSGMILAYESFVPNKAHELLRGGIENRHTQFPPQWNGWGQSGPMFSTPDQMRNFIEDKRGLSGTERNRAEIDLALFQLSAVERKLTPSGTIYLDKCGQYEFVSNCRKDSAYAMLYGHFGIWILEEARRIQSLAEQEADSIAIADIDP